MRQTGELELTRLGVVKDEKGSQGTCSWPPVWKLTGTDGRCRKPPSKQHLQQSHYVNLINATSVLQTPFWGVEIETDRRAHLPDSVRDSLKHFELLRGRQPSVHGENTEVLLHPGASEGPSLFYEHGNNSLHFLLQPEQYRAHSQRGCTLTAHSSHLDTENCTKKTHCNCSNSGTLTSSLHAVIFLREIAINNK